MKSIQRISIHNYLGVEVVELHPDKFTVFAGENGVGKSSILKALQDLFEGISGCVVREGADKMRIEVGTGDLDIRRTQTPGGKPTLTVKDAKGSTLAKPQAVLNAMIGSAFAFSPLTFLDKKPGEQVDYYLKAVPVVVHPDEVHPDHPMRDGEHGLSYLKRVGKAVYDERAEVGREGKTAAGVLKAAEQTLRATAKPEGEAVSIDDATVAERKTWGALLTAEADLDAWRKREEGLAEVRKRQAAAQADHDALVSQSGDFDALVAAHGKACEQTNLLAKKNETARERAAAEVSKAETLLARAKESERSVVVECTANETAAREKEAAAGAACVAEKARMQRTDEAAARIADLDAQLTSQPEPSTSTAATAHGDAQTALLNASAHKEHQRAAATEADARTTHDALTASYEACTVVVKRYRDELPAAILARSDATIEGVDIGPDGLTWNGRPLSKCCDAERLQVAFDITCKLAGDLPLVCIDGYEKLGAKKRKEFREVAEKRDVQCFLTRVADIADDGDTVVSGGRLA